jgi:hypothetical protein
VGVKVDIAGSGVAVTDGKGRFSMPTPSASDIRITVNKIGFLERRISYAFKDAPPEIEIRLKQAETGIYGRVLDSNGIPISKFRISVQSSAIKSHLPHLRLFDSDNGTFAIMDVPPGTYDVEVEFQPNPSALPRMIMNINRVEIRKGYFYGEILFQFPSPADKEN